MNKTIYVDVTNTKNIHHVTGIQRVVLNISKNLQLNNPNVILISLDAFGFYRQVDYGFIEKTINKISLWFYIKKFLKLILPMRLIAVLKKTQSLFVKSVSKFEPAASINVNDKDIILLLDATWNYSPWNEVSRFRAQGASIVQVVYDLIPLSNPEFFTLELTNAFKAWFKLISIHCDSLYCISNTVVKNVSDRLTSESYVRVKEVRQLYLGYDFSANSDGAVTLKRKPGVTFITVGTIEPRKNHQFILEAFENIWAQNDCEINWIIVGRLGWKSDYIYKVLKNHPESNIRLFFYENANDELLQSLYSISDCAIIASVDEGYGLPIIESLHNKCKIIASDIPIFREFELPEESYFSLENPINLAKKLLDYDNTKFEVSIHENFKKSWSECSDLLYRDLMR